MFKNLEQLGLGNLWFSRAGKYDQQHQGTFADESVVAALKELNGAGFNFKPQISAGYANVGHSNNKGGEHINGSTVDFGLSGMNAGQQKQLKDWLMANGASRFLEEGTGTTNHHFHVGFGGKNKAKDTQAQQQATNNALLQNLPQVQQFKPTPTIQNQTPDAYNQLRAKQQQILANLTSQAVVPKDTGNMLGAAVEGFSPIIAEQTGLHGPQDPSWIDQGAGLLGTAGRSIAGFLGGPVVGFANLLGQGGENEVYRQEAQLKAGNRSGYNVPAIATGALANTALGAVAPGYGGSLLSKVGTGALLGAAGTAAPLLVDDQTSNQERINAGLFGAASGGLFGGASHFLPGHAKAIPEPTAKDPLLLTGGKSPLQIGGDVYTPPSHQLTGDVATILPDGSVMLKQTPMGKAANLNLAPEHPLLTGTNPEAPKMLTGGQAPKLLTGDVPLETAPGREMIVGPGEGQKKFRRSTASRAETDVQNLSGTLVHNTTPEMQGTRLGAEGDQGVLLRGRKLPGSIERLAPDEVIPGQTIEPEATIPPVETQPSPVVPKLQPDGLYAKDTISPASDITFEGRRAAQKGLRAIADEQARPKEDFKILEVEPKKFMIHDTKLPVTKNLRNESPVSNVSESTLPNTPEQIVTPQNEALTPSETIASDVGVQPKKVEPQVETVSKGGNERTTRFNYEPSDPLDHHRSLGEMFQKQPDYAFNEPKQYLKVKANDGVKTLRGDVNEELSAGRWQTAIDNGQNLSFPYWGEGNTSGVKWKTVTPKYFSTTGTGALKGVGVNNEGKLAEYFFDAFDGRTNSGYPSGMLSPPQVVKGKSFEINEATTRAKKTSSDKLQAKRADVKDLTQVLPKDHPSAKEVERIAKVLSKRKLSVTELNQAHEMIKRLTDDAKDALLKSIENTEGKC